MAIIVVAKNIFSGFKIKKGVIMNISPVSSVSNNKNQPTFKMAFKKPSPEVGEFFRDTLKSMPKKERDVFVKNVETIVQRAKSCPIPIEQVVETGKEGTAYGAKVGNITYSYSANKSQNKAQSILNTMDRAVWAAENEHNLNTNFNKLIKSFE